jgi:hypothetical protein
LCNGCLIEKSFSGKSFADSNDETGFEVERAGSLITTTAANATSYSDSGLSCGTTYNYSVKAINAVGDSTAATASVTTQACPPPSDSGTTTPPPSGSTSGIPTCPTTGVIKGMCSNRGQVLTDTTIVKIESFGLINFKQNGKTYRGVVDYLVTQGESTKRALQVESIPDANGDGIEDVMLVFPNGEQQRMFVIE